MLQVVSFRVLDGYKPRSRDDSCPEVVSLWAKLPVRLSLKAGHIQCNYQVVSRKRKPVLLKGYKHSGTGELCPRRVVRANNMTLCVATIIVSKMMAHWDTRDRGLW
jgi:hypothetical protein